MSAGRAFPIGYGLCSKVNDRKRGFCDDDEGTGTCHAGEDRKAD